MLCSPVHFEELVLVLEHARHHEVAQAPQLRQIILDGRAREQDLDLCAVAAAVTGVSGPHCLQHHQSSGIEPRSAAGCHTHALVYVLMTRRKAQPSFLMRWPSSMTSTRQGISDKKSASFIATYTRMDGTGRQSRTHCASSQAAPPAEVRDSATDLVRRHEDGHGRLALASTTLALRREGLLVEAHGLALFTLA